MAEYSMDLRTRVLRDSDAGMPSKEVAAKYAVSRAWPCWRLMLPKLSPSAAFCSASVPLYNTQ